MSALTAVFAQGLAASRPAAAATNNGWFYFATDTSGGTLYQSNGSSWLQLAPGVSSAGGVSPYYCRCHKSGAQAITTGSFQAITYDTNDYDNDSMHSTVTNTSRITATHAGVYVVRGYLQWNNTGGGNQRAIELRVNGATAYNSVNVPGSGTIDLAYVVSDQFNLSASDYVELLAFQDSGGSINVLSSSFSAARVG